MVDRGFSSWDLKMMESYEVIHSRPDPAQRNKVKVKPIPESLDYVSMVNQLSHNDITKHKEIFGLLYEEVLIQLSYWHYRDRYLEQVQKQINLKNKNK